MITEAVYDEDDPDQRQKQDLAGDEADDGRVAPTANAPESPMNTCAGWTLNHRKPSRAPINSAHRIARFSWPARRAMIR